MLMIRDRIDIIILKHTRVSKNAVLTTTVHMKTKYFLKRFANSKKVPKEKSFGISLQKEIGWKSLTLFIAPIYSEVTNSARELFLIFLYYSFRGRGHLISIYNWLILYILCICLTEVLESDQTFAKIAQ